MNGEKKKNTKKIVIICTVAAVAVAAGVTAFFLTKDKLFPPAKQTSASAASGTAEQTYSEKTAALSNENFVTFEKGFTETRVTDEAGAMRAVEEIKDAIGIENPGEELKLENVNTFDGETYYRMQQYYNGVPVYGKDVILVADSSGEVTSLSANTVKMDSSVKAADPKAAENVDLKKIAESVKAFLSDAKLNIDDFSFASLPETAYYMNADKQVVPCLIEHITFTCADKKSYSFKVVFDCDANTVVTCSAETGNVKTSTTASGQDSKGVTRSFAATEENGVYTMEDSERNIKVYNVNGNTLEPVRAISDSDGNLYLVDDGALYDTSGNRVYISSDGERIFDRQGNTLGTGLKWDLYLSSEPVDNVTEAQNSSSSWNDSKAVNAVSRVSNAYDFYDKVLERQSFDGYGGKTIVCYNDYLGGDSTNAYSYYNYDVTLLSFGTDNDAEFDTVGHEYTHSVLNSIVDLDYNGESGALHEAYADIFGELVEDYSDGTLDGSCNWKESEFRDLANPAADGNPTSYKGDNWHTTFSLPDYLKDSPLSIIDLFTDNGGVHSNCTIISHAAYVMNQGIDGDARTKIDTELLARIWYKSMFSMHADETFEQCADHVYDAATRTSGVTIYQLDCVRKAFEAAGLNVKTQVAPTVRRGTVVYVIDANGNRAQNYSVSIEDFFGGNAVEKAVTDDSGFTLDVEPGTYLVTVSADGKSSYVKTINVIAQGSTAQNRYINIFTDY